MPRHGSTQQHGASPEKNRMSIFLTAAALRNGSHFWNMDKQFPNFNELDAPARNSHCSQALEKLLLKSLHTIKDSVPCILNLAPYFPKFLQDSIIASDEFYPSKENDLVNFRLFHYNRRKQHPSPAQLALPQLLTANIVGYGKMESLVVD